VTDVWSEPSLWGRALNRVEDGALALRAVARLGLEWLGSGHVYNPLTPSALADPYALYRRLRERDPVHRSHLVGGWVVFGYREVAAALRDPRLSSDDRLNARHAAIRARLLRRGALDGQLSERPSMLRLDPPDHTRLRSLVQRAFTPRAVARLQERIAAHVEALLDAVGERPRLELVADLAHPLPVIVIAELLGVSPADRPLFKRWSAELAASVGQARVAPMRRATRARLELRAYLERVAAEREREPQDDLLSALLHAQEAGARLSRDEVFTMLTLLLVAGNETTTHWIGNSALCLLRHPEQLERLRAQPQLLDAALDEVLRYESPVQGTLRIAREDLELGGRRVRRGQQLILLLGSAHRDPAQFPDPDRFDLARQSGEHLAFGSGRHGCLGSALARLEARTALAALLRRYPRLELEPGPLRWQPNAVLRGLRELPLRADASAR
jgi:cytochrome P450